MTARPRRPSTSRRTDSSRRRADGRQATHGSDRKPLPQKDASGLQARLRFVSIFGLVIGVIPGLSGHFAMAMAVTFLYSLEPSAGIAFILGAHATVAQGGGLTAILFSTPGTGQNAATLLDGPPMRDKGEAGTAVGAAMAACFLGATFGASLGFMLPVSTPPNALVYGSGYVPIVKMVRYGLLLDIMGVLAVVGVLYFLGPIVLG